MTRPPSPDVRPLASDRDRWGTNPILTVAAALFALAAIARRNGMAIARNDIYEGDAAQHTWWAQRAWGGDLVETDDIAAYFASDAAAPMGYRWIVEGLARFGDVQLMTELALVPVMLATFWLLWVLGNRMARGSRVGGVVAIALAVVLPVAALLFGMGLLQRHFSLGILALAVLGLHRRQLWLSGLALLLAALVYPIAIATVGLLGFAHECIMLARTRRLPRGWIPAALLGVAALVAFALRDVPDSYGELVTLEQMRSMPIFAEDGRSRFFDSDAVRFWFDSGRTGLGMSPPEVVGVIVMLAVLVALAGVRRVPLLAWLTPAVGVLLFVAAHATLLKLYLPNRHIGTTLPLGIMLIAAATAGPAARRVRAILWRRGRRWRGGDGRPLAWLAGPSPRVALASAVGAVGAFQLAVGLYWAIVNTNRPAEWADAVAYLRTLPPESKIVTPPGGFLDALPLRTGRAALANRETTQGYYPDWYKAVVLPRLEATYDAYAADDWAEIDRLYDTYDVRVLVHQDVPPEAALPERNPQRQFALDAAASHAGEPVVNAPPPERVILRDGDLTLLRVGPPLDQE